MNFRIRPWMTGALSAATLTALSIIPASAETLTVKSGDSLWKIAHSHHISLQSLEKANPNAVPLNLQIGAILELPSKTTKDTVAHRATMTAKSAPAKHAVSTPRATASSSQNDDVYWLAKLIHAEAVAEPYNAQVAVGDVVVHRVGEPGFANSVKGVIFQVSNGHYQFTCVQNGFINTQPTSENIRAARDVLFGHKDLVPGADVFYNPSQTSSSSWVRKQPFVASIGSFVFAK